MYKSGDVVLAETTIQCSLEDALLRCRQFRVGAEHLRERHEFRRYRRPCGKAGECPARC